jgi:hypothetical protein
MHVRPHGALQETIGQGFQLAGGTLVKVGTTEVNPTAAVRRITML